ncbi:MAG: hypothetical protein WCD76_04830 [Pyrinomonadaceae bacterium]
MSSDEHDARTLERHYRVMLDFRLQAVEITEEVCRESATRTGRKGPEPYSAEEVERQSRLYDLLRADPKTLEQYLLSVLTQEAGSYASEGLMHAFDAQEEGELLVPLYRRMAEEDERYFEECRQMGVLSENTELIAAAFKVEWVGVEVEEMSRRLAGDVHRAEVVRRTKMRLMRKLNERE